MLSALSLVEVPVRGPRPVLSMKRLVLALLMVAFAVGLLIFSIHQRATDKKAGHIQIIEEPAVESATDNAAIIRWTTNTGSSLIERSVVRYGTDPKNLSGRAESPNRWNQNLPFMIHRVQVTNLAPETSYYYTVESMEADGTSHGVKSTVKQFTTK
jgi:hypothetical protein